MVSKSKTRQQKKEEAARESLKKLLDKRSQQLIENSKTDPLARAFLAERTDYIPANSRILIACEGEKTEPFYFDGMKKAWRMAIDLELVTAQGDPLSVVTSAVGYVGKGYDEIWAVFDRDEFPEQRIQDAFSLAQSNGIKIVFSNESFELWYLLHFCYLDTHTGRDTLCSRLEDFLECSYQKNDPAMFMKLRGRMCPAIKNSLRLAETLHMYDQQAIISNPFTGMHHIIAALASNSSRLKAINPDHPIVEEIENIITACSSN